MATSPGSKSCIVISTLPRGKTLLKTTIQHSFPRTVELTHNVLLLLNIFVARVLNPAAKCIQKIITLVRPTCLRSTDSTADLPYFCFTSRANPSKEWFWVSNFWWTVSSLAIFFSRTAIWCVRSNFLDFCLSLYFCWAILFFFLATSKGSSASEPLIFFSNIHTFQFCWSQYFCIADQGQKTLLPPSCATGYLVTSHLALISAYTLYEQGPLFKYCFENWFPKSTHSLMNLILLYLQILYTALYKHAW